jgi:lambda family phage portal protein
MSEIVAPQRTHDFASDPRFHGGGGILPGQGWTSRPNLSSSDILVNRTKDGFAADARDASRSNPYGKSALRSQVDAVIGTELTLRLEPQADMLGVSADEAAEWADKVETQWAVTAASSFCPLDAQRKQTFTGLMRTAYACFYVAGEALATIEWKAGHDGTRTCMNLIDAERLSDPRGMQDIVHGRRMGVERDQHGAPLAYHIREKHPADSWMFGPLDNYKWKRVPRYTPWGRQNVLHCFEQDRPDMTRGMSSFTTALLPMRLLNDYMVTELESAAIRATYAAVIESELDYEEAMKVVGDEYASTITKNPILDFTLRQMADKATFYRGQDVRFGKSKVAHLLPNEKLHMVQGTQSATAVKDFSDINLYTLASALGVDHASLTKNYSKTNYSGARASLYDVWRSYEVRRSTIVDGFGWPFFVAWLEEQVALRKTIPMLGNKSFYEVTDALCFGSFEGWTKPRLDPLKENQADQVFYNMGGLSLRDICKVDGRDYRKVLNDRAREKALMKKLGLKPEDINPELIMNQGAQPTKPEGTGSEGGSSTGSSG